jgi:plasmid stabilization system protein ParE
MKIIRTRKANGDLLRIYSYLAAHHRHAAEAMVRNVIIYRPQRDSVTILRVIDGRMDIEAEFDR